VTTTLIAYHGDPKIKAKYLRRVRAHRRADELVQGTGWADGKGCAVGCTLDAYRHSRYPIELGIPEVLARLEDALFEQIPRRNRDAWLAWPEEFLAAIKPGADLAPVWPQWAVWMLLDETHGVIRHAKGQPGCEAPIRAVANLWRNGGTPEQFRQARSAAATYAAAAAATYYAAAAAAAAADADAALAADDAADAAAAATADAAAARAKWNTAARAKLLDLLRAAPMAAA
jgi:hypothetical protein